MKNISFYLVLILIIASCSPRATYNENMDVIIQEWDDAIKVAHSTAKINLSQPIAHLQEIKRTTLANKTPKQFEACHKHLTNHMELTIEAFLLFMKDQDADTTILFEKADDEIDEWLICRLPKKEGVLLKTRLAKAEDYSKSVCFGVGYGTGIFTYDYPKIPFNGSEYYEELLGDNTPIRSVLEENIKEYNKEYMIPLIRKKMNRNCFSDYQNGFLYGLTGTNLKKANLSSFDLAEAFATTTKNAIVSTFKIDNKLENKKIIPQAHKEDPMRVSGIIEGDIPIAIIGGDTLKIGDTINEFTIKDIQKDYVEFIDKNGNVFQKHISD